jgi:hypothetical protein
MRSNPRQWLRRRSVLKRNVIAVVLSLVIGLPLGAMVTILLTPVLWDLEPVLHMELAGHSGPADWVFEVMWAVEIPLLFLTFRWLLREKADAQLDSE